MHDWNTFQSYGYTRSLSARDWAWEFLRRNPDFNRACQQSALLPKVHDTQPSDRLVADAHLLAWGLIFRRPS
jgi:Proteobacterial transcriptional regulator-like domain